MEGLWTKDGWMIVSDNEVIQQEVASLCHNHSIAGHPGIRNTIALTARQFWWSFMKNYLTNYVKGCTTCQSMKPSQHKSRVPLYLITPEPSMHPFATVTMDLIVGLPPLQEFNSILIVIDYNITKVAFFLPCTQTVASEDIASLYAQHITPHYGVPRKVISDRDVWFTSHFSKELCQQLGITNNMSFAYHPQTDGQSEQSNQWVKQYLQIYVNHA